ncbi:MAG: hypothetical protein II008_03935 [Oscillospiraceae bacterium]|nr:hypothetical protein [Oscillospiraceae bacterium]
MKIIDISDPGSGVSVFLGAAASAPFNVSLGSALIDVAEGKLYFFVEDDGSRYWQEFGGDGTITET